MEKIVKDGKVAVAVSFGFGSGWSSELKNINPMDARFNQLFIEGKHDEVVKICKEENLGYADGAKDVEIVWVDESADFVITECDGHEDIITIGDKGWYTA